MPHPAERVEQRRALQRLPALAAPRAHPQSEAAASVMSPAEPARRPEGDTPPRRCASRATAAPAYVEARAKWAPPRRQVNDNGTEEDQNRAAVSQFRHAVRNPNGNATPY